MFVMPSSALFVYTVWANAFITATLCSVQEVGDAQSTTRRTVGIHCLAPTHFSRNTTLKEVQGRALNCIGQYV